MKILHVYKQYYPDSFGGIEQVIFQTAEQTKKLGLDPEVFTFSSNSEPKTIRHSNHIVHRAKKNFEISSTPFSLSGLSKFKSLVKNFDLIHYQFPNPFGDALHLLSGTSKPFIVSYQSDIVKQKYLYFLYYPLMKSFLSKANLIVASSPNYLATSPILKVFKEKTIVIPNGISEDSYPEPDKDLIFKYKSKYGEKFFLFVGSLRYYKGLLSLLDAAVFCDYPIVISGSGGIEADLKKKAQDLKLKNVFFTGEISDIEKSALLYCCYGFVFPSNLRSEAFGVSMLEAAMYGKPLICCEIGTGTTYINQNRLTGLVVKPNSPKELFQAMKELWDNPSLADFCGKNAKIRYHELFTAEKSAISYKQAYIKILE